MNADIADDGSINVENHFVGRLRGFRFTPDAQAEGIHGKAARNAAAQVLSEELGDARPPRRGGQGRRLQARRNGRILWRDEEIAQLEPARIR